MPLDTWLAFVAACTILTLIPGPSVLLVISQALTKGTRAALICIWGDVFGGVVLMGLSFLGVGAILATSAVLFQGVKWAGVLYLAYLGYRQIRQANNGGFDMSAPKTPSNRSSFWAGMITAVLNPKAIIFYMAFLAQFIDPSANMAVQTAILISTSTIVVAVLLAGYALIAARARATLSSASAQRKIGYTGGTCLIGGSVLMAATR